MEYANQSSLSDYLRHTINDYLKKKSHSLITLSDKSGIHYNTLARILKGRVESPSLETALGILKVCQTGQAAFEALRTYFPDYDMILGMVQTERDVNQEAMLDLQRFLNDSVSLRIIALARTRDGLLIQDIKEAFGQLGLERLQTLRDREWLVVEEDRVRLDQRRLGMDLKISYDFMKALAGFLKQESDPRNTALLWTQVERFNDDGYAALRSASMDFLHEVESIKNDPRYQGNKPCFVSSFLSGFDFPQLGEAGLH